MPAEPPVARGRVGRERGRSQGSPGGPSQTIVVKRDVKVLSRRYTQISKMTGAMMRVDFQALSKVPPGMNPYDWYIVNVVDFLQRVELIYGPCTVFCTDDTCPMISAGPQYHYNWEDENTLQPLQLSAPEYWRTLKAWMTHKLQEFPRDKGLTPDQINFLRTSCRRLFRILAHIYVCHGEKVKKMEFEEHINTVFMHYRFFAIQYAMISESDVEMLNPVVEACERFIRNGWKAPVDTSPGPADRSD